MEFRVLAGTGLTVSRICLGTMTFGNQVRSQEGVDIIHFALDQGINFIDTADVYAKGESERVVGNGLKGCREKVILASKVGGPFGDDNNERGLSIRWITKQVENSLKRLETDYLDICYMHMPDYYTPMEESLYAMDQLVKSGKVRYIAVSNYAAWQIMDMKMCCERHGYRAPSVTQNIYNLINRGIERELVPCISNHKMGLVVYSPLCAGLLSGKHTTEPSAGSRIANDKLYYKRYWKKENIEAIKSLENIALTNGIGLIKLAYSWLFSQKYVDSVLLGVTNLSQMEEDIRNCDGTLLNNEVLNQCKMVWQTIDDQSFQYNR